MLASALPVAFALFMTAGGSAQSPTDGGSPDPFDPFELVGVCAVKSETRSWSVVWHPRATGTDPEAIRVFRRLEASDFNDCLALLIESDDATRKTVLRFASEPTAENAKSAADATRHRWASYGVGRAIREVASTSARGPFVDRVLASCRDIRHPKGRNEPRSSILGLPRRPFFAKTFDFVTPKSVPIEKWHQLNVSTMDPPARAAERPDFNVFVTPSQKEETP